MRKAIIVGGSGGLGQAIIEQLSAKQITIVNVSRKPAHNVAHNIPIDLTNEQSIAAAGEAIRQEHSDANIFVYCAGLMHWHETQNTPVHEVTNDLAVNITGAIQLTSFVLPIIKENKGDLVFIGSSNSFVSYGGGDAVYTAAKHAVLGFVKALQLEYKKEDVRIIGVYPGGFKSEFHILAQTANLKQEDLMDPSDIAHMIVTSLEMPRNVEISEIIISRKKRA